MNNTELTLPSYAFSSALYESGMTCSHGPWEKMDSIDREMLHRFAELIWSASKRDSALCELTKVSQEIGDY